MYYGCIHICIYIYSLPSHGYVDGSPPSSRGRRVLRPQGLCGKHPTLGWDLNLSQLVERLSLYT